MFVGEKSFCDTIHNVIRNLSYQTNVVESKSTTITSKICCEYKVTRQEYSSKVQVPQKFTLNTRGLYIILTVNPESY